VPKALALLVVAAVLAVGAGIAMPASAIRAGSNSLSATAFDNELAAIKTSPMFQCYRAAVVFSSSQGQSQAPTVSGVSAQTRSSLAADLWADQRATQLSIESFVQRHDPSAFSAAALTTAREQYEEVLVSTLDQAFSTQSSSAAFSCPAVVIEGAHPRLVSGATIFSTLPTWFQETQVRAEAASLGLIALLPSSVRLPESGAALRQWYTQHATEFETTCFAYIQVASAQAASSVRAKITAGLSFAEAARRYSTDTTTNKKGGAVGCYSPNSPDWSAIESYVGTTKTGNVKVAGQLQAGGPYYLFSPTKRTANHFAQVEAGVQRQNHSLNVQNAEVLGNSIQLATPVSVGSWLGDWQLDQLGGQVIPTPVPPSDAITNASANTPTG
jgi:hypothetical protein